MLFVVANLARTLDVDPEDALRSTNAKFARRFQLHRSAPGRARQDAGPVGPRRDGRALGRGQGGGRAGGKSECRDRRSRRLSAVAGTSLSATRAEQLLELAERLGRQADRQADRRRPCRRGARAPGRGGRARRWPRPRRPARRRPPAAPRRPGRRRRSSRASQPSPGHRRDRQRPAGGRGARRPSTVVAVVGAAAGRSCSRPPGCARSSMSTPSRSSTVAHVAGLGLALGAGDVAHVQDDVGLLHLLQRGAEGLDQLVRQVGDEAHGVGQDRRPAVGQLQRRAASGRGWRTACPRPPPRPGSGG